MNSQPETQPICPHGFPAGSRCEACAAELASQRPPKFRSYWDQESVRSAQRALDVWASVRIALRTECGIPTLDRIFEAPVPYLPSFAVYEGKKGDRRLVTSWESRYASVTGTAVTPSTTRKPFPVQMQVFVAVEEVLRDLGISAAAVHRLGYPRTGPFSITEDGQEMSRSQEPTIPLPLGGAQPLDRVKGQLHRCVIEGVRAKVGRGERR